MVGGRQVLLSLAVLYGAGPNSALGGLLRLQDGYQSIGGPSFANTTSRTSSSVSLQAPTTTAATTSTIALVASTPVEPGTTLTSSIRRPPALPPNVGIPSVVSVEWKSSSAVVDMGVIKATVDTNSANPTSTADEYVYPPAMYGSDGALTTESDAFTRSVVATRNSIVPNQGTGRAPPPVDAPVTSSSAMVIIVPPRPPPLPKPVEPDSEDTPNDNLEESTLAPGGSTSNAQTPAAAAPTPPRFPPAPPTKNLASSTAQFTFSLVVTNIPSPTSTFGGYFNVSVPYTNQTAATPAPTPSSSLSFCQASDYTITRTVWSIVHTETITWYGKPEDYTPAYPTIATPTPTCIDIMSPPRFTVSVCTSTGTDSKYATCWLSTSTQTFVYGGNSLVPPNPITFTTTDKNPAVVYTTIETPDYGVSQEASTRRDYVSPTNHPTPIQTPQYQSSQRPGQKPGPQYMSSEPATPPPSPAPKPITVIVQPTAVIIGTSTIKDNTSSRTQTVVISDETFTVDPTRVVGGGATIDRPSVTGGGVVYPPRPTTTTLANVRVVISSSVAVIGGSSFTLGPTPTTAVVSGRTFTISPSGVAVDSQTFSLPSYPVPTEVVVADGQLITAIGKSVIVIKSTTITYGPGVSTTQIGDDLITFGPGGVTIPGGSVLGGPTAKSGETQFAVAGGVTITKIGFSTVVVGGQTYTVSPEMGTTSTVVEVGGERVTIASGGVTVGTTFSMAVPFGPVTVITPGATRAAGSSGVRETGKASSGAASSSGSVGGEGEPDEDAAGMVRPGLGILGTMVLAVLVCIL